MRAKLNLTNVIETLRNDNRMNVKTVEIFFRIIEEEEENAMNTNIITVKDIINNLYDGAYAKERIKDYTEEELNIIVDNWSFIDESCGDWIIQAYHLSNGKIFYVNTRTDTHEGIVGKICSEDECLQHLHECGIDYRKSDIRGKNMENNSTPKILPTENKKVPDTKTEISVEKQPTKEAALDRYTKYFLKIGERIFNRCKDSLVHGYSGDQISYGHLKEIVRRPGNGTVYKNEVGVDLTNRLIPHISHRSSKKAVRIAPERMIQLTKCWVVYGINGTDKEAAICSESDIAYLKDGNGTKKGSREAVINLLHENMWYVVKGFKPFKG